MSDFNPYQAPSSQQFRLGADARHYPGELDQVRSGLLITYYGVVAILGVMVLGPLLMVGLDFAGIVAGRLLILLLPFVVFGGLVAAVYGQFVCLTVPSDSGCKGAVTTAVVCQGVSLFVAVGIFVLVVTQVADGGVGPSIAFIAGTANILASTLLAVGIVSFLIFIKRLNRYINRGDLAVSANTTMVMMIGMIVTFVIISIAVVATDAGGRGPNPNGLGMMIGCFGLLFFIFGLFVFMKYANLLTYTAKAIGEMVDRGEEDEEISLGSFG